MNESNASPTTTPLEHQVVENFQQILARYQQMNAMLDNMLQNQSNGNPIQEQLHALQQHREEIEAIQTHAGPTREAYRQSQTHASDSVKQLSALTTTLIQTIMAKISSLEETTKKSYRQLIPEIDQNVRSHQMKTAYGNSSTG